MPFEFGLKDVADIFCVAFLLYYAYRLMKASGSLNIFFGILVFILTWSFAYIMQMKMLGSIFQSLLNVGVIALIVIFQEEIRRFLLTLGSQRRLPAIARFFSRRIANEDDDDEEMMLLPVVMACDSMSKNLVGALIIIERDMSLADIVKSGEFIDAKINTELIKNIFFKNSPLHDGAMIIRRNRIVAAGCILPVSHSLNIPKDLGLRHRAALGITQQSDAIAIIVSEETGAINIAHRGEFKLRLAGNELESYLVNNLK